MFVLLSLRDENRFLVWEEIWGSLKLWMESPWVFLKVKYQHKGSRESKWKVRIKKVYESKARTVLFQLSFQVNEQTQRHTISVVTEISIIPVSINFCSRILRVAVNIQGGLMGIGFLFSQVLMHLHPFTYGDSFVLFICRKICICAKCPSNWYYTSCSWFFS